jgi:uncharacterized protein YndB with AHSA1/START domain
MNAEGGYEVAFHGEFREIVPNERLGLDEIFEGRSRRRGGGEHRDLRRARGRTTVTVVMQLPSKEVRDMIIESGMEGGMQEGMDLLEQVADLTR